jgi:hypothetical protein
VKKIIIISSGVMEGELVKGLNAFGSHLKGLLKLQVQYPTKKSERRFFCFEPPIHISGNCLALDLNSGGKEQSEWWELGRMKKRIYRLN